MSVERYNEIAKIPKDFKETEIITSIPTPKEADYKRGYIVRYFIQKVNDELAPIHEISSKMFSRYQSNTIFKTISLDWRLTGTTEEVRNSNGASVRLASQDMKKISWYLPNLLQFYKN